MCAIPVGQAVIARIDVRLAEAAGVTKPLAYDHFETRNGLLAALASAAGDPVLIASSDLFYDPDSSRRQRWAAAGAVAVEMEAATLFTVARLRGAAAGCVLLVSDELAGEEPCRIGEEALTRGELALGEAGLAGLAP